MHARKGRVGENAVDHRLAAADAVSQDSEEQASDRAPDKKRREGVISPLVYEGVVIRNPEDLGHGLRFKHCP